MNLCGVVFACAETRFTDVASHIHMLFPHFTILSIPCTLNRCAKECKERDGEWRREQNMDMSFM